MFSTNLLATMMKTLPRECINHIFGYTYNPQPPELTFEIRENYKKMQIFKIYFDRVNSLSLYGNQFMQEYLYNMILHTSIYVELSLKVIEYKSWFSHRYVYVLIYRHMNISDNNKNVKRYDKESLRTFNKMSFDQINDILYSLDRLVLKSWYVNNTGLPPFPWMYENPDAAAAPARKILSPKYSKLVQIFTHGIVDLTPMNLL